MPKRAKKKGRKGRKKSAWIKHVMATYRKNKKAGFSAAMRRAKATYRKKKRK